jgi:Uma2 family endonuclease
MGALPKMPMTVDQYLAWAVEHPGRYELRNGSVIAMSPETVGHIDRKTAIHSALRSAIRAKALSCFAVGDGATVRIDDTTAYEPDALVYCGEKLPSKAIEVPGPVIVVEVLSASTRSIDLSIKLADYFRLPSVMHYLIVDPDRRRVVHHARGPDDVIATRIVTDGVIGLDPPGLKLAFADIYAE